MPKNNQKRPVGLSKFGKIVAAGTALVMATASQAAVTVPDFTANQTDLTTVLGGMIGFGAFVWGARKLSNFVG